MARNERFYRGNPHLKSAFTQTEYTLEQIMEIKRCSEDIFYFTKHYAKITTPDADVIPFDPYPFQHEFIENMEDSRLVVLLSSRQSGKCFCINTIVKIKNKSTGIVEEITIGELHERIKSKRVPKL